jgi:hypothetical protein
MSTQAVKPVKSSPKDFFLYLLQFVALYLCVSNFIGLGFVFLNWLLKVDHLFFVEMLLRWNIATLIVAFPVFMVSSLYLAKDRQLHPEKKDLKIRKWLTYFTMFVLILIMMFRIVSLLFSFLGDNFTLVFMMRGFLLFVTLGLILYFYYRDIHNGWTLPQLKLIFLIVTAIIVFALMSGIFFLKTMKHPKPAAVRDVPQGSSPIQKTRY